MKPLNWLLMLVLLALTVIPSCAAPAATLGLIEQGDKALAMSAASLDQARLREQKALDGQVAQLDAAFDADVRLAASGQLHDANGAAVTLSPDWVISARKGYSAARGILERNAATLDAGYAAAQDNVAAGREALGMARTLVIDSQRLSGDVKAWMLQSGARAAGRPRRRRIKGRPCFGLCADDADGGGGVGTGPSALDFTMTGVGDQSSRQAFDAWAQEHPSLAAVIDRISVLEIMEEQLRHTPEYLAAVQAFRDGKAENELIAMLLPVAKAVLATFLAA